PSGLHVADADDRVARRAARPHVHAARRARWRGGRDGDLRATERRAPGDDRSAARRAGAAHHAAMMARLVAALILIAALVAASGPFPVIMVYTPYGKDTTGAASGQEGGPEAGSQAGPLPYFVKRGYIDVVAEVRGTGDSGGTFDLLAPIEGRDGAELVNWASKLPHSNGRVGMYGPSYMGIDQYMTADNLGPRSPLKAL